MEHLRTVKNLSGQNAPSRRDGKIIKHILVFSVSLFIVLTALVNYGNILNLVREFEYFIFPNKQSAEYERLTIELISLYGSGHLSRYQEKQKPVQDRRANASSLIPEISDYGRLNQAYLYIPVIDINAPIIVGSSTEERTILNELKRGVLIYPGSNLPGDNGSTVIIGHSSSNTPWQKYSYVFSSLPKLSKGDMIIINYNDRKYSYSVDKKIIGSVNELAALDIKGDLILGTCWPIGTDEKRILITASLVQSS